MIAFFYRLCFRSHGTIVESTISCGIAGILGKRYLNCGLVILFALSFLSLFSFTFALSCGCVYVQQRLACFQQILDTGLPQKHSHINVKITGLNFKRAQPATPEQFLESVKLALLAGHEIGHFLAAVDHPHFTCDVSRWAELAILHDAAVHPLGSLWSTSMILWERYNGGKLCLMGSNSIQHCIYIYTANVWYMMYCTYT